jgi:hypothetical protein
LGTFIRVEIDDVVFAHGEALVYGTHVDAVKVSTRVLDVIVP